MEIDHIFVFVEPDGAELSYFGSLGLVETYRRSHRGQGTQNTCFCFDNMFVECLWVCDVAELRSDAVARTGLYKRSQWRTAGTSPFGIAWRAAGDAGSFEPATWAYRPPYLPAGLSIDVSVDSDDPRQPMMFSSPGTTPPALWPAERQRNLQRAAGLGSVLAVRLALTHAVCPSPTLRALADATLLAISPAVAERPCLTIEVERLSQAAPLVIELPVYRPDGTR